MHFVHVAHWFSRCTAAWRHGFESRVADLATSRGVEGSLGGFPGGPRSQAGSRADEVDRTVPEVYQSGAVSVHFCTASGSVQFGTLLTLLSSMVPMRRLGRRPDRRSGGGDGASAGVGLHHLLQNAAAADTFARRSAHCGWRAAPLFHGAATDFIARGHLQDLPRPSPIIS